MKTLIAFIKTLRPSQWTKNFLVFAGLIFSRQFLDGKSILINIITFFIFCFVSGFVYTVNDIKDAEIDRTHPQKKFRPIANGDISKTFAVCLVFPLLAASLIGSYFISKGLLIILSVYVILNLLYSLYLKRIVILDIMIVASGFLLRAVGGVIAINTELTHWFVITVFFLALLISAGKRRHEFLISDDTMKKRVVIEDYSLPLIDQIIAISSSISLVTYSLYTIHMYEIGTVPYLFTSIPFVVFGIFRYLYIIYKKNGGGSPEKVFLKDKQMIINMGFYLVIIIILMIFNHK